MRTKRNQILKRIKMIAGAIGAIMLIMFIGVGGEIALGALLGAGYMIYAIPAVLTLLEIKDLKGQLLEENRKIFEKAGSEEREITGEEQDKIDKNLEKVRNLTLREANQRYLEQDPGEPIEKKQAKKSEPQFSMIRAIRDVINSNQAPGFVRDIYSMAQRELRDAGCDVTGQINIPGPKMPHFSSGLSKEQRADILAGTPTAGQEIIEEDKRAILPPLVDRLVLAQAGASYLPNLVGNVSIPSYAGTTVGWKGEIIEADDGGGAFKEVIFTPKRLTAYLHVSKLFLIQDGVGAEILLMNNIANAVARKLEKTILGNGTLHSDYPSGIGYKLHYDNAGGVASIVPTWANMVAMETAVDTANALQGNLAYVTNSGGRGLLKTTPKVTESPKYICEENQVNGYPLLVTNAAPSDSGQGADGNLIVFANWADLMIGQWGGYDITVDPYTRAKFGQVVIVINAYFDAKGLRGSTGADTTLDEYAISFAAEAIKSI